MAGRADKVWGLYTVINGKSARVIVRARSQLAAVELMRQAGLKSMTEHFFRHYAEVTGNKLELETATEPGVWRYEQDEFSRELVRML